MRRVPALLLLAALLGGIGAASVHEAHHALEWADAQTSHAADRHGGADDRAQEPCVDGEAHALDCAICTGLSVAALDRRASADVLTSDVQQIGAREAYVDIRRAVAPARGPPAVA